MYFTPTDNSAQSRPDFALKAPRHWHKAWAKPYGSVDITGNKKP
jgi:hypothetical protein